MPQNVIEHLHTARSLDEGVEVVVPLIPLLRCAQVVRVQWCSWTWR